MPSRIHELLDIPHLQILADKLYLATSIPFTIADASGDILVGAGWQPLCINFHRANPITAQMCTESDCQLRRFSENEPYTIYKCPMGLIDASMPLMIENELIGFIYSGQFLFEKPDLEKFRQQARKYGFPEEEYLQALELIPIFTKNQVEKNLDFIVELAHNFAKVGYKNLQLTNKQNELEKIRFVMEESSFPILWSKADGELFYTNRASCEMLHYSKEELLGMNISQINQEYVNNWKSYYKSIKANKTLNYEAVHKKKNGETIPVEITANLLELNNEEIIIGYINDLTERKKAEKIYHESVMKFMQIIELIPYPVLIIGSDNEFEYINSEFLKVFEYSLKDVPNTDIWFERVYPDCEARRNATLRFNEIIISAQKVIEPPIIATLRTNSGSLRKLALRLIPLEKKRYFVIFEDLALLEEREKETIRAQKIESLALLAGGIAHDYNNILTGIMGNINLLQLIVPKDQEIEEILNDLINATRRASELTDQLLTFSKGGDPIRKPQFIAPILMESIKFVMRSSNCTYKIDGVKKLPPSNIDAGQLNQVFNNLLINAIQSMPEGGLVNITAEVLAEDEFLEIYLENRKYIKISFQDHGIGIPREMQSQIFQPYFSTKPNGNGLGLATCYSIIKKHDGILTFKSEQNIGSEFIIYLPISKSAIIESKNTITNQNTFSGHVLIMDDDPIVQNIFCKMLQKLGFEVSVANEGKSAIEIFKRKRNSSTPLRIIFLDLVVPVGIGGKETIKLIREIDREIPVVVSSGYSSDRVVAHYKDYEFSDYLNKPFKIDQLVEVLNRNLGNTKKVSEVIE